MSNHPHGPCQCGDHLPHVCQGPAAYAVIRDGKLQRVCTTCSYPDDKVIRVLPAPHEMDIYMAWDALTGRQLERQVLRHIKVN
jgi:hypothetical protein